MNYDFSHPLQIKAFQKQVYAYFKSSGRKLPWRTDYNPYHIFISEIMLQQTQVERVAVKFPPFIRRFPDFKSLAESKLEDLYREWQGLGYNRRATALRDAAKIITTSYNGKLPENPDLLIMLPGIGKATSASIAAFAFNKPVVFLETNIRTVLIYHFFSAHENVDDKRLYDIAERVLDIKSPRKWYSALMDYGTMLKKQHGNLSRRSTSYRKQTPFNGSLRQVRGEILKLLLDHTTLSVQTLQRLTNYQKASLNEALVQLVNDNLVREEHNTYKIAE